MNLAGLILKWWGWKLDISVPDYPKVIICVAPHTSNWDFIMGKLAYAAVGRHAGFLMKEAWFVFPLGLIFRAIGGIPVPKKRGSDLVEAIAEKFKTRQHMAVAITPEGTRSLSSKWRTGFLQIARLADVPIVLGVIDYAKKEITITRTFTPSVDTEADMAKIKLYYKDAIGKYPEKFTTD